MTQVTEDGVRTCTFQEFSRTADRGAYVLEAIKEHKASRDYRIALDADLYDRQTNKTIHEYVKTIYSLTGMKLVNFTASNQKIASNFFHRLNTQRCMYSLGAGVSFVDPVGNDATDGGRDTTKEALGRYFDHDLQEAAYYALIHKVSFCFWNLDRMHVFPLTEFVPFWDENDGTLRAGARFWRLNSSCPMTVVLYEEDGYTKFVTDGSDDNRLEEVEPKRSYITNVESTPAGGDVVVGEENYSSLPIVPLWGSKLHQSTLVGMRDSIDSYDLIKSGFANDLTDCAQVYWLIENAGGMTDDDVRQFLDRLLLNHAAVVDSDSGGKVSPYTQEVPYQARQALLKELRSGIYEDFGALDVHAVAAGATNDHIDAGYQPMDEEAADFEYQISECVMKILSLMGIEDSPVFKRTRISNQMEQVQMVATEAQWLDHETILRKLPNVTPDEVSNILNRVDAEDQYRMMGGTPGGVQEEEDEE